MFYGIIAVMKAPDLDRIRSEKKLSPADFLKSYNENLPSAFPRASLPFLKIFKKANPALFKDKSPWSLDQHRKKLMDWLPQHIKSLLDN